MNTPFRSNSISVQGAIYQPSSQIPVSSWRSKDSSFRPVLWSLSYASPFKFNFIYITVSLFNVHTEVVFRYCFCSKCVCFFLSKFCTSWVFDRKRGQYEKNLSFPSYFCHHFALLLCVILVSCSSFVLVDVLFAQLCPTLCDPMNCCPPGSDVRGILQARILEWVAIPFSRRSSQSRDQTLVSCIAGRFFTIWATREALLSATDAFFFDISSASYGPNTGLFFFFPVLHVKLFHCKPECFYFRCSMITF